MGLSISATYLVSCCQAKFNLLYCSQATNEARFAHARYSRTSLIRIERDQTPSEYMKFPD